MAIEDDTIDQHPPKRSKPNLPPEIISEILSRLPVKSLLQSRSVSKSWRSMISDPKFVKTHLTNCSKDDEISSHKIGFIPKHDAVFKTCHLSPVLNGFTVNPMELDYPHKHPDWSDCIVGSINGLICIIIDELDTFLWNPSTRVSKKVPDSGIKRSRDDWIVHGFGYDESTDDYKVVVICGPCFPNVFATEVMVYSSRTGFWTRIGDFPSGISLDEPSKFVNGKIHWAASQETGSNFFCSWLIVSLDVANGSYGEVAQPSYGDEDDFEMSLGVSGECLFVLYYFHGSHSDVWMMKEYGVKESWTKLTSIPYHMIDISEFYTNPALLYLTKNGEILLEFDSHIVLYDPQSKSFKNPDIRNFDGCFEASIYLESLVSPLIQEGLGRQQ